MMKEKLRKILHDTFQITSQKEGWSASLPAFEVERPKVKEHGDLSSNIAMLLARPLKLAPRVVGEALLRHLQDPEQILAQSGLAGAGFLNFRFKKEAWQQLLSQVYAAGDRFGTSKVGQGKKVVIEYVSANPTGPLHIGNARGGPMGDVIAALLQWTGYQVVREYYLNDVGGQIDKLGESILCELRAIENPDQITETPQAERHYTGSYVREIALAAQQELSGKLKVDEEEQKRILGKFGVQFLFEEIKRDCDAMGISFDSYVHEKTILVSQLTDEMIKLLKERGVTQEKEGALWFTPEGAGEDALADRESVLVRSDGRPTYFANDIAYHVGKYRNHYDRLINVWGSNHHGHVPRVQAAVKALGFDPQRIETVLYQYVRVKRGNDLLKMSKRAGNYVTAREVLDEVGKDAFRFFLLMRAASSHLDFDLELAKQQSQENPVYYVQYAHARLCSIFRKASEQGIKLAAQPALEKLDLPEELRLIALIQEFPDEVLLAAERLEPHRIPFYLLELAQAFQSYYSLAKQDPKYRVLGSDVDTTQAKMYLCHILKTTLAQGLKLIGVTAPEIMTGGLTHE